VAEEDLITGVREKGPPFRELLARHGLTPDRTGVMGDDVFDLPLFTTDAFKATTPEAHPEIRKRADFVTNRSGGRGAVREVVDLILKARGLYDPMIEELLR
jgi:3-deoxy-D-manno-octulosonate 8-phosphate phosphatase (KDO 8-P phosphatase)